ncbi:golgin subfamily A member 2-like isoform X1 [Nymphalis io]|uniref:golgin subfamily A member 2-like isoform X1 n=1 Tax=Inachis io TaxID=171585 RepID=UPI0021671AE1|nr:golgin subfamily A member 2-like isoform X1 [Nymphalis io]
MDIRAEKLAKARKKLRDHQEKKVVTGQKEEILVEQKPKENLNDNVNLMTVNTTDHDKKYGINSNQNESIVNMDADKNASEIKSDVITEMLISNKANLEFQMNEMSTKIANLESLYELEKRNHNDCKQKNIALQNEISDLKTKYKIAIQEVSSKVEDMAHLKEALQFLHDEKNNLFEELELTKSILNRKELENTQLFHQISTYQSQINMLQIQLQQLTNDSLGNFDPSYTKKHQDTETLLDKIYELERSVEMTHREKEELISQYNQYAQDISEKLKAEQHKNEMKSIELRKLQDREQSLVEQISEIEIRLQNHISRNDELCRQQKHDRELKDQYKTTKVNLEKMIVKYNELQKQYLDSQEKIQELTRAKEIQNYENNRYNQENVNISKLNADIVSDKLAAQRATEQNEQLKVDMEGLEQIIVKLGKDKLELTEKWTHEKQLNKGLALKLAEVEESVKTLQNQLKAKDDEMIRLLNEFREMEKRHENTLKDVSEMKHNLDTDNTEECSVEKHHDTDLDNEKSLLTTTPHTDTKVKLDNLCIPKEDAMIKLQERFLNIMDEVANLSDEKHRLEHIILQLQNETDTICEYVALYQQQRSLLKKREEERSNQLKIFQAECDKLKRHLEELSDLLLRFAADKELTSFLKNETRLNDLARVKELLEELQNCSLINPKFKNLDLNIFYPCHCCSGQLIDI